MERNKDDLTRNSVKIINCQWSEVNYSQERKN